MPALLQGFGCIVLGPYATGAATIAGIQTQRPDVALLDIRLSDGAVASVADALTKSGVPFALLTLASDPSELKGLACALRLVKPFAYERAEETLCDLVEMSR